MKKSFLASLLAFALVLGVAFPLSSGLKAKAATDEEAIAQIKSAFNEIYTTKTVLTPTRQKISTVSAAAISEGETEGKSYYVKTGNALPSVGGEAVKLGDTWGLFREFGDGSSTSSADSTNRMLFDYKKGGYPAEDAGKMKDYELSLYVASAPENKDIFLKFNSVIKDGTSYKSGLFTVSSDNIGKWITIKSSDLSNQNWQYILKNVDFTDSANILQLQVNVYDSVANEATGPVIYTGSILGHFAIDTPAAFNDENATLNDVIFAAKKVITDNKNVSEIYNLDALETAVNNVVENLSEDQVKSLLVTTYNNLEKASVLQTKLYKDAVFSFVPSREKAGGTNYDAVSANSGAYFTNTDENIANLPYGIDKAYIGDAYLKFERSYNAGSSSSDRLMFGDYNAFGDYNSSTMTFTDAMGDYSDLKLALYIQDVSKAGIVQFEFVSTSSTTVNAKCFDISPSLAGKWIVLSLSDMFNGDIEALNTAINGNLGFFQLTSRGAVYKGYIGSLVKTKSIDQINVSSYNNFDIIDTILAVDDLATANADCANIQVLADFLTILKTKYATEIVSRREIKSAADEVKSAYNSVKTETVTSIKPFDEKKNGSTGTASAVGAENFFVTDEHSFIENTDLALSQKLMGTNFAHIHWLYDNIGTNGVTGYPGYGDSSTDRIIHGYSSGYWANFDMSDYDGFYLNAYIKDVKSEGSLFPFIITVKADASGSDKYLSGNKISVTNDLAGKWVTLTDKDLYNGGLSAIKADSGNIHLGSLQLGLCETLAVDGYFGSVVFYKNPDPVDMSAMTYEEVYTFAKNKLAEFDAAGAPETTDLRNALVKLGNALSKTTVKGCVSGNYTLGVTVKDAVRLNAYLNDNTVAIDKYAADINNDGVINETDLTLLLDLILK